MPAKTSGADFQAGFSRESTAIGSAQDHMMENSESQDTQPSAMAVCGCWCRCSMLRCQNDDVVSQLLAENCRRIHSAKSRSNPSAPHPVHVKSAPDFPSKRRMTLSASDPDAGLISSRIPMRFKKVWKR